MPKRTESEILRELDDVDNQLSPENLTCDGELAPSQVRTRYAQLKRREAALIKELGRDPRRASLEGW